MVETLSSARRTALSIAVVALALAVAPVASAGKGSGGGGGKNTGGTGTLSLVMVVDANGNGLPNWGDTVTFNTSTTATTEPHVDLICSQNGTVVYSATSGFYASYPWPWTKNMTLKSTSWSGGQASCTARLYYFSGTSSVTLATLPFTAYA